MRWWRATFMPVARLRWISWGLMTLLSACAFVPHENEWITVGYTTKEEVIDAYGEPDLVMAATEGETVVYRPMHSSRVHSALPRWCRVYLRIADSDKTGGPTGSLHPDKSALF